MCQPLYVKKEIGWLMTLRSPNSRIFDYKEFKESLAQNLICKQIEIMQNIPYNEYFQIRTHKTLTRKKNESCKK